MQVVYNNCSWFGTKRTQPAKGAVKIQLKRDMSPWIIPLFNCSLCRNTDGGERSGSFLNTINPEVLLGEGRVYGGGLHKLEPKELNNVSVSRISELLPEKTASQSMI